MNRTNEALKELFGERKYFNRDDYALAVIATLGYSPSEIEIDVHFESKFLLNQEELAGLILKKQALRTKEDHQQELYRCFDVDYKGYIDVSDVQRVWQRLSSKLAWGIVQDCFNAISLNGKISYEAFVKLF